MEKGREGEEEGKRTSDRRQEKGTTASEKQ